MPSVCQFSGIGATLQVTRVHAHPRHFHDFVAIQVVEGVDDVVAIPRLGVVLLQEHIGRARHARDVHRIDESFRTERLRVSHQQLHRFLMRLAAAAVEHRFFVIR